MLAAEHLVLNLDDAATKRQLLTRIGALRRLWRLELVRYRPRRTDRQNRWYWPCIVGAFAQYLNEQDYEVTSPEQAHEILKAKFLTVDVVHKQTGNVLGQRVRSTTELDVEEFTGYAERCRAWLLEFFGIMVPDPE
jgi:hypothetical protein